MPEKVSVKEKENIKLKEPKGFKVVMYNDDFTPMDFVVNILMSIFQKRYEEAIMLMMAVHKGKKAVVGNYPYDIARSKVDKAMSLARDEGYPFRILVEET